MNEKNVLAWYVPAGDSRSGHCIPLVTMIRAQAERVAADRGVKATPLVADNSGRVS